MWWVISEENLTQFPKFETAVSYAEASAHDGALVIDTIKRVISIVEPEKFDSEKHSNKECA